MPPHGPGLQPSILTDARDLGRCPKLVWDGPLAHNIKPENRENVPIYFPPSSGTVRLLLPEAIRHKAQVGGFGDGQGDLVLDDGERDRRLVIAQCVS